MQIPLRLIRVSGPAIDEIVVAPTQTPRVIGRSTDSDVVVCDPEGTVSRRHAEVVVHADGWRIMDLLSRHGTFLNGAKLSPGLPRTLCDGDQVRIGPWTLRVAQGGAHAGVRHTYAQTLDDTGTRVSIVRRPDALGASTRRRLDLLMSCAAEIGAAHDVSALATLAVGAIAEGTGFSRAAFVRPTGDAGGVSILAARGMQPESARISRSLVAAALEGSTATLCASEAPSYGQSIVSLDIRSAICAPVMLDGVCDALLYLDARGNEATPGAELDDAVGFAQAIARLCELSLRNLQRLRLEQDERRRRGELQAARDIQRIIMPPTSGSHARLEYHVRCVPGRFVAGDLFDFFPIDAHHAAVLLGDVAGKGVAAGMVMANVQAHLSHLLRSTRDVAASINEANALVSRYSDRHTSETGGLIIFLSLWAGLFDLRAKTLTYVDAGHGYALWSPDGSFQPLDAEGGGPPIGADADARYVARTVAFAPNASLVLYSDGVAEQTSPTGEFFGVERTAAVFEHSRQDLSGGVRGLVAALRDFAGLTSNEAELAFADDVTVAALAYLGE